MKGLVIHAKPNFRQDKADYLDEKYFRLLARKLKSAHPHADIHIEDFEEDNSTEFMADLAKPEYTGLDLFAYIGHGGTQAIYSADWNRNDITATDIANRLEVSCNNDAVILLYACNMGRLSNSFAKTIYDLTVHKRFRIYGHASSGRAGNNPDKTVFPPANGAMLIDVCLGDLANAPRFSRAWRATMGNERDNLWATFFTLTNNELLHRSCRSVIERAVRANRRYMRTLGWQSRLSDIYSKVGITDPYVLLGMLTLDDEELAVSIARWQYPIFGRTNDTDGILGPTSWRHIQREL